VAATGLTADLVVRRGSWSLPVAFEVSAGCVLAVTGRNGVGKTSLLLAVAGLVEATGCLQLGERDLLPLLPEDRGCGVAFQDRRLPPWLSAGRAAAMGGDRDRAFAWLDRWQVPHRTRVERLSGGQAQRVALARALSADRSLVLLDEPFAALDAAAVPSVRDDVLGHCRAAEVPVLLVTHNAKDLAAADAVLELT
jgi:ABC-type sulfate/molybdate transport systems ATPase subunit